jgi:hypothetical protein
MVDNSIKSSLPVRDLVFLEELTSAVVEEARVYSGVFLEGRGANTTGGTLVRPGGRDCYPAFWIRDFAMSLESGLIGLDEQKHALLLTAGTQNSRDQFTKKASFIPKGAIADHILLDGRPVFFPGTYDPMEQGGAFGYLPPLDDHFFFINMAWHYVSSSNNTDILCEPVQGIKMIDRLEMAYSVPPSDENCLVVCGDEDRGVNFGFYDTVVHTGRLLFCSLLKYNAALQMAFLSGCSGNTQAKEIYARDAECIKKSTGVFAADNGLLRASTAKSSQPDVWGSAFAVYSDAVDEQTKMRICGSLAKAYAEGTLSFRGSIRHVLTSDDFSNESVWQQVLIAQSGEDFRKNRYQNGAYWATPVGWVCYAIAQADPKRALELATEYVTDLKQGDFRKGPDFGSPWECIHPEGNYRQNPVYMTSVTCPLAAFRRMASDK